MSKSGSIIGWEKRKRRKRRKRKSEKNHFHVVAVRISKVSLWHDDGRNQREILKDLLVKVLELNCIIQFLSYSENKE